MNRRSLLVFVLLDFLLVTNFSLALLLLLLTFYVRRPVDFSTFPSLLLIGLSSGLPLVLFAALFVFGTFSGQPVYTGLIADYSPEGAVGRSYGVSFFAGFGIGSLAASFAGFFADRWGTDAVFLALAGFEIVTLALALGIWRLGERAPEHGALAARRVV